MAGCALAGATGAEAMPANGKSRGKQAVRPSNIGRVASNPPWELAAHLVVFKTSGFKIFAGHFPSKKSRTLVAAMQAILVRVSNEADARCGASTTFGRFSPARINGSFS